MLKDSELTSIRQTFLPDEEAKRQRYKAVICHLMHGMPVEITRKDGTRYVLCWVNEKGEVGMFKTEVVDE